MSSFSVEVPNGEFDLPLCVSSGQVFRFQSLPDGRWLGVDGDHWYLVEIGLNSLEIQSNGGRADFERLFRLDWDAAEVERKIVAAGPELEPYMGAFRGLRVMRPSSPEETFFSFLCTPNNNVARITGMVRALASYGQVVDEVEGIIVHRFPSAEIIAGIPEQELRERRFGYRAKTITQAARQLLEKGDDWLDGLKQRTYQEASQELLTIGGVGPKLADCIALFGLHHTEAVPIDTHVWQQVVRLYRPDWAGKPISMQRYIEAGDIFRSRFGKLAAWAQQYLFYDNMSNWRLRSPG